MLNKTPKEDSEKTASAPKHRRIILVSLVITLLLGTGIGLYLRQNRNIILSSCSADTLPETTIITIGNDKLVAEVTSTDQQKQLGLSGRPCLEDGTAMLFPYSEPGNLCFWMKDMRFPIDMVWLDKGKKVVTIKADATPDSFPQSFCPSRPAQYVVEVQAGLAKSLGWKPGTQFNF